MLLAGLAAVMGGGCGAGTARTVEPSRTGAIELTVFAAASLRHSFERLAERYRDVAPGTSITFAFDASSAHRARLEQGARADVFAAADVVNPQAVADAGLAAAAPRTFAGNTVVLVTPPDDPAGIATPMDLARPGVRIIGAGERVPIARYATQAVTALGARPDAPLDYAAKVAANVVSREDDVAAVVAKLRLGEGDAGFVYATDAQRVPELRVVELPKEANVVAAYAVIRLRDAPHRDDAQAFLEWLLGVDAQAVLREDGFGAPPGPP
jgi:molybdate transport system substrate-binding protein